jgi:hypothetical protein
VHPVAGVQQQPRSDAAAPRDREVEDPQRDLRHGLITGDRRPGGEAADARTEAHDGRQQSDRIAGEADGERPGAGLQGGPSRSLSRGHQEPQDPVGLLARQVMDPSPELPQAPDVGRRHLGALPSPPLQDLPFLAAAQHRQVRLGATERIGH